MKVDAGGCYLLQVAPPDKNFQVHEPELYVPQIVELNKNMDYEKVYLYSMSVGV